MTSLSLSHFLMVDNGTRGGLILSCPGDPAPGYRRHPRGSLFTETVVFVPVSVLAGSIRPRSVHSRPDGCACFLQWSSIQSIRYSSEGWQSAPTAWTLDFIYGTWSWLVTDVASQSSSTRVRVLATLRALRYTTVELLITPLQFGIPNSRLRYYLLAKASPLAFAGTDGQEDRVWRHIPGHGTDWIDPRTQGRAGEESVEGEVAELRDFLDEDAGVEPHPHAIPERVLEKWGRLFDIVLPSARRTCCFTRGECDLLPATRGRTPMFTHPHGHGMAERV